MGVHSAEQVHPLAGDPDEGFIHVPGRGFPLYLALQASVQFRAVRLSPAPDGGMVDSHAPLRHQLFHVTQTQAEPQIPSDASHDDVRLELAFPKQRRLGGCHGITLPDSQLQHFRGETPLEQVRRAIWLGCTRKYVAMLNGQTRQPITSLAYFASLIEEVRQPQIPASYWDHVRRRMEEMERRWLRNVNVPPATAMAETLPPEML
jgi:hypothetical protein